MADVLTTTRVTRPGAYIGRINRTSPSGLTGYARLPAYVGKGSRLRTVFNEAIRRSYLSNVPLTFPTVAPHLVTLVYPAVNDQTISRLFSSDGTIVPASKWQFLESVPGSGTYDSVLMAPEAFDITVTYTLDYQSTSRLIKDVLPFDNIRQARFVGDAENQTLYDEFVHYFIPVSRSAISSDTSNANSSTTATGFEPARVIGTVVGNSTTPFVPAPAPDTLDIKIDGGTTYSVTLTAAAVTAALAATEINAVIGSAGYALDDGLGHLEIRSASFDAGASSVEITGGTYAATLGLASAQFPTSAMAAATVTSGGYMRRSATAANSSYVAIKGTSSSSHKYNRRYRLTVTSVAPNIVMDLEVLSDSGSAFPELVPGVAVPASSFFDAGASGTQPQVPFHGSVPNTSTSLDFGPAAAGVHPDVSFTDITGDTVTFVLDEGTTAIAATDTFETTSVGPSMLEWDSSLANTAQHSSFSDVGQGSLSQTASPYKVSVGAAPSGTGTVALRYDAEYTGAYNRRFLVVCSNSPAPAGGAGVHTATFYWQSWGEFDDLQYDGASRTFAIDEGLGTQTNVPLMDGVALALDFGAGNFAAGDMFWFQANADRTFITAKDDRSYAVEVATVGALTTLDNQVTFTYSSGTPEGGFGLPGVSGPQGKFFLAGGINVWARNVGSKTTAANRFAIGDKWAYDTVSDDVVDWSLTTLVTETISPTQVVTDTLGVITGTVGMKYAVLNNVPSAIKYGKDTATGNSFPSFAVSTSQPYIKFTTAPTSNIEVRYEYIGLEPAPASLFYFTANTLRPSSLYNVPIRVLDYDSAAQLLGPSSMKNDLLIMAQLALDDNNAPGAYFVQAEDSDGDGVITTVDINVAIKSTEKQKSLTDVIVLSSFGSLSASLSSNEKMNDPFERGERALWVGAPLGTAIGNEDTPGTLIFLAQRTLQVFGDNHAHGKRVMIANTEASKTITLTDGTQVLVPLDGSFIAGAFAARNASFADPGETLLRKNLFGFDSITTYSDPEELQLIGASMVFVTNTGDDIAPVYRIEESTTVDRSSDDNNEISVAINQKEFVTREIRTNMDIALISIVPPSEQAGVAIIKSFLVMSLQSLLARNIIAEYTDSTGGSRALDSDTDVRVFRAKSGKTAYNFQYFWNGRYPIKRLFGLYSVDRKFFGSQV